MSYDPRALAQKRIHDLGLLIKAADAMIEQEQALIAHPIPYAGKAWDRANAALLNAAYDCFECDELLSRAREVDPDWMEESPVRAGLCEWVRGVAA